MGASPWQIIVVVIIVAVLFGGKRLRNLGGDIGASLKGFKKAMKDEDLTNSIEKTSDDIDAEVISRVKEEEKS